MTNIQANLVLLTTLFTLPTSLLAHPGHDHGHWASPAVHTVLLVAAVSVISVGIWFHRSRRAKAVRQQEK